MTESYEFLKSVLDTITEHIAVIDSKGDILFVNKGWSSFGQNNACLIEDTWSGINYLTECDKAAALGDDFGIKAGSGIKSVINAEIEKFYLEYPCNSPDEVRWFMMRVTTFAIQGAKRYVISHQNITERKLAEEAVLKLSRIDGLTNIPNRRYFDEFLDNEWLRCLRLGLPISLAIIDLDHFKMLNDTYGHQRGDECLKSVAGVLQRFANRPSDICARYGGEEFAIVYGSTSLEQAKVPISKLLDEIFLLNIANKNSPTSPCLTASIGLATIYPEQENKMSELIKKADKALYWAKQNGRNQICC
ncbi:MAG: sensor domain-containing diguanylate cyclase [Psychromonas sp.]